ncbi:putative receptor like protein 25 [Neltuma alba]|uniref:putative receptor like protein 25 n=1 Tax=Neltuma alba TaxID=207710 RepID=UPI0010A4A73F|nr:putative receptor like protein 25 [Prosopis alba]
MTGKDHLAVGLNYMENKHNGVSYRESVMVTIKGNEVELERILTIFTAIDLLNNMFDGEISYVTGELRLLKGLNLSHNKITGSIPQSIANLTNLEWLDLSSNRLRGGIPLALTNLNFFEVLNLSQNQLVGEIPRDVRMGRTIESGILAKNEEENLKWDLWASMVLIYDA